MVFKKPYGFLIKHFKLIHLILTGLLIYLTMNVSNILAYYNNYILRTVGKLEAINYVTNYYMIAVLLAIVICVVMYILLRYKKKPRAFYLILILFVLVVSFMIELVQGGLETIYFSVLETKTLRLYRDMLRILVVFQYISIGFVLVRGLGFDIKKFNFVEDLQELDLDISDEEEVELTLGSTNTLQRKFNRRIRELKYYYLENKTFIHIILIVVLVLGISSCVVKNEVVDKVYEQGEVFSSNEFQFQVTNSYVTGMSYDNQKVGGKDAVFVIVKMKLSSMSGEGAFNDANLILEVNYNSYASGSYYASRFVDLGNAYRGQKISGGEEYLFIYSILEEDIGNKMKLVYANEQTVNLNPVMLDEEKDKEEYKVGDKIDLANSTFGSGYLEITSFEVAERFTYPYEYEVGGKLYTNNYDITSNNKVIIKINSSASYPYNLDSYTFLDTYATLKYEIDGTEYEVNNFINKTPGNHKEGLYLAVDKEVMSATSVWFDIKIRNMQYIYKLK